MFPQWMSYCESSIRFLPRSWPWLRTLVKPIIIFTIFLANLWPISLRTFFQQNVEMGIIGEILTAKLETVLTIVVAIMSPDLVQPARNGVARNRTGMDLIHLEITIIVGIRTESHTLGATQWSPRDGNFVGLEHAISVTKSKTRLESKVLSLERLYPLFSAKVPNKQ